MRGVSQTTCAERDTNVPNRLTPRRHRARREEEMPKSLVEFIVEAIDEALPAGSPITGLQVYMRAFERSERYYFERQMKAKRREMEKALPLLTQEE